MESSKKKRKFETSECNVCYEEIILPNLIDCFSKCSYKVCTKCIIKILKVGKCITYKCPQCRGTADYTFVSNPKKKKCNKKFSKLCTTDTDIIDGIYEKFTNLCNMDYNSDTDSMPELEFDPPRLTVRIPPYYPPPNLRMSQNLSPIGPPEDEQNTDEWFSQTQNFSPNGPPFDRITDEQITSEWEQWRYHSQRRNVLTASQVISNTQQLWGMSEIIDNREDLYCPITVNGQALISAESQEQIT